MGFQVVVSAFYTRLSNFKINTELEANTLVAVIADAMPADFRPLSVHEQRPKRKPHAQCNTCTKRYNYNGWGVAFGETTLKKRGE